jgi:SAM-dependent methyltransferase
LTGWDVIYDGRIATELPWDFAAIVTEEARRSPDLLDMGTGGGELLSRLPVRPPRTVATEGWPPNVPIARDRLGPLGVEVVAVAGAPDNVDQVEPVAGGELPFGDGAFHLVSNRHESYLAGEVHRILVPDGVFLTQQVAAGEADEWRQVLTGEDPQPPERAWNLSFATAQLEAAGFTIEDAAAGNATQVFTDGGAVAWYLTNLPWVWPEFSIQTHTAALRRLHQQIDSDGPLRVRQPLFWLRARRPSAH